MVNKTFNAPVTVAGQPEFWRHAMPWAHTVADDELLELAPGAHDLVVHSMGLHWSNDLVGQLIQCRNALRPDGAFFGVLFGGRTLNELRAVLAQAESEVAGGLSPRVAPMAEIRDLGALLQRSGFSLPVADSLVLDASYESPWHLMADLRAMGEGNALSGRLRRFTRSAVIRRAAELYQTNFSREDGRVKATFELVFLHGWAPDPSQPKPLRPGSAQARLAEALGAREVPLED